MTKKTLLATTLTVAALSLTGCGVFGSSWDVKMEVLGQGTATIRTEFPGERNAPKQETLPFSVTRNVGFGFITLDVTNAPAGSLCRVLVDDKLVKEVPADAQGGCGANVNNQDK